MKSYYELLHIKEDADIQTVKRAFHRLAKQYHPDISQDNSKFLKILMAYKKILNEKLNNTDSKIRSKEETQGTNGLKKLLILPKNRVSFALSLMDIARMGIFYRGKVKRGNGPYNLKGYDVSVFVTETELGYEPIINIDVPAKVICPVCMGSDTLCPLCSGTGNIVRAVEVPVTLPATAENNEILTINLSKVKLRNYAYFLIKQLRVKIKII